MFAIESIRSIFTAICVLLLIYQIGNVAAAKKKKDVTYKCHELECYKRCRASYGDRSAPRNCYVVGLCDDKNNICKCYMHKMHSTYEFLALPND